jgi:hypothetical protein
MIVGGPPSCHNGSPARAADRKSFVIGGSHAASILHSMSSRNTSAFATSVRSHEALLAEQGESQEQISSDPLRQTCNVSAYPPADAVLTEQ